MHKLIASKAFGISLSVICFALTFAGMFATFFWLMVPVVLVGLPVAIFGKSQRAKEIAASCLMALVVLIVLFLGKDIMET